MDYKTFKEKLTQKYKEANCEIPPEGMIILIFLSFTVVFEDQNKIMRKALKRERKIEKGKERASYEI